MKKAKGFVLLLLSINLIAAWHFTSAIPAPSIPSVIEPGSMTLPCSYINYQDGTKYLGHNGKTGANDFVSSDAGLIINQEIAAMTIGGTICMKSGVYTGSDVLINKGINLVGEGWGQVENQGGEPTLLVFSIVVNSTVGKLQGVQIRNLWVGLITPNRSKIGISLNGVSRCTIDNVFITGFGEGILVNGYSTSGYENTISHVRIIDNTPGNFMTYGVHFNATGNNLANNNYVQYSSIAAGVGIYVQRAQGILIQYNDISNNINSAIRTCTSSNCSKLTVEDNFFEIEPRGIEVDPPTGPSAYLQMFLKDNVWGTQIPFPLYNVVPAADSIVLEPTLMTQFTTQTLLPSNITTTATSPLVGTGYSQAIKTATGRVLITFVGNLGGNVTGETITVAIFACQCVPPAGNATTYSGSNLIQSTIQVDNAKRQLVILYRLDATLLFLFQPPQVYTIFVVWKVSAGKGTMFTGTEMEFQEITAV